MPADLFRAVQHAHLILNWQENLTREEIPPEWMWSLSEELEDWFEEVEAARRDKYGGDSGDKVVPLEQNEYAREWKRRRGA